MAQEDGRLAGKVAIVTGAGSVVGDVAGIGQAISVAFAREGAQVAVVDKDKQRAQNTADAIASHGGSAEIFEADVTRPEHCEATVAAVVDHLARVDVLVNNVGVGERYTQPIVGQEPPHSFDEADWDHVLGTNLKSAVLMTQAATSRMTDGGSVINIASIAGLLPGVGAYNASKAALLMETRGRAMALARRRVRVNAIAPGCVDTPMSRQAYAVLPPVRGELRRRMIPLGFEGTAEDVAWAAIFLASDEARFVTAQCLTVDGGTSATPPLAAYAFIEQSANNEM